MPDPISAMLPSLVASQGGFPRRAPHPTFPNAKLTGNSPALARALNQSSSFSRQVSSATGCPGSARTAQTEGKSWEHFASMGESKEPRGRARGLFLQKQAKVAEI